MKQGLRSVQAAIIPNLLKSLFSQCLERPIAQHTTPEMLDRGFVVATSKGRLRPRKGACAKHCNGHAKPWLQ